MVGSKSESLLPRCLPDRPLVPILRQIWPTFKFVGAKALPYLGSRKIDIIINLAVWKVLTQHALFFCTRAFGLFHCTPVVFILAPYLFCFQGLVTVGLGEGAEYVRVMFTVKNTLTSHNACFPFNPRRIKNIYLTHLALPAHH